MLVVLVVLAFQTLTGLPRWSSPAQLADELGLPVQTLYAWRKRGVGPKSYKIGSHLRYQREDVETWLESRARDTAES